MDERRTHCIRGSVQMAVNKKTNPQILCCHRRHTWAPTHPDKRGRAGTIVPPFLTSRTVSQIHFFLYWSVNCGLLIEIDSGRGFLSVSSGVTVKIHFENERRTFFVVQPEDVFISCGASALRHCGEFRWSKQWRNAVWETPTHTKLCGQHLKWWFPVSEKFSALL